MPRYTTVYTYNANNFLTQIDVANINEAGVQDAGNPFWTTTFTSTTLDLVASRAEEVTSGVFLTTSFTRDASDNVIQITPPITTRPITQEFDERNFLFKRTRGAGTADASTDQWDFDGNGNVSKHTNGDSIVDSTRTYDGYDRLTRDRDNNDTGHYTEFTYDASSNVTFVKRFNSVGTLLAQTENGFDPSERNWRSDRLFQNSDGLAVGDGLARTDFRFDHRSLLVETTEDDGEKTFFAYDAAERLTRVNDHIDGENGGGNGNETAYTLDQNGNATSVVETQFNQLLGANETFTVARQYDNLNRVKLITEDPTPGLNLQTTLKYNSLHQNVIVIDAASRTTKRTFDGLSRLTETVFDSGGLNVTVKQEWDNNSNLSAQIDHNNAATRYSYNGRDSLTGISFQDGTSKSFTLNKRDLPTSITDQATNVMTNTFDNAGLLTNRSISRAAGFIGTDTELYSYDGLYRLTGAQNKEGATNLANMTFAWDTLSQNDKTTMTWGTRAARTVARILDAEGSVTKLTYPGGRVIDQTFDAIDRLDQILESAVEQVNYDCPRRRVVHRRTGCLLAPSPI